MIIYNILTYAGIIMFMVYSGFTVNYYKRISEERMKNGSSFCESHPDIDPDKIENSLTISLVLLTLSSIVFVLKINHDILANCNYEEGKAKGLISKITSNSNLWWSVLVLVIYAITIYELATIDKFDKCPEDVTNSSGLVIVNSIVVGIISLIILIYGYYKFILKKPLPFSGGSVDLGGGVDSGGATS